MTMLSKETVEQVKQFPDITMVVRDYVGLKKAGRNFVGLCPFHSEKTPSFTVSPEKRIFHCFGCHASGDLVSFVMKVENVGFVDAVVHIAQRVGIPVTYDERQMSTEDHKQQKIWEDTHDFMYACALYFHECLLQSPEFFSYFQSRGLTPKTISDFRLGYCPSVQDLLTWIESQGLLLDIAVRSGVLAQSERGGWWSPFQHRLMVPIHSVMGKVVGFGGRVTQDQQTGAKYINSVDSPWFNKRQLLFGLDRAKSAIRKLGYVLVVEGYLDVMCAHQFGFENAVAPMGTAVTRDHVQRLSRICSRVVMAFDNDEAGRAAIEKSYTLFRENNIQVDVLAYEGKDPAESLFTHGAASFSSAIASSQSYISFLLERLAPKAGESVRIEVLSKVIDRLVELVKTEPDKIVQNHYVQAIAKRLEVDQDLILVKISSLRYPKRERVFFQNKIHVGKVEKSEEALIFLLSIHPELRGRIFEKLDTYLFSIPDNQKIVDVIKSSDCVGIALIDKFEEVGLQTRLRRILIQGESGKSQVSAAQIDDYLSNLLQNSKQAQITALKNEIKVFERNGEEDKANVLLQKLSTLFSESVE